MEKNKEYDGLYSKWTKIAKELAEFTGQNIRTNVDIKDFVRGYEQKVKNREKGAEKRKNRFIPEEDRRKKVRMDL